MHIANVADALVFKCEDLTGHTTYQALPCQDPMQYQSILKIATKSYYYGPIDPKAYSNNQPKVRRSRANTNIAAKQAAQRKRALQQQQRIAAKFNKQEQQQQRKYQQQHKKQQQIAAKLLRQKIRCQNVKLKIQILENRLRTGYTVKQERSINAQLIQLANLQDKNCN